MQFMFFGSPTAAVQANQPADLMDAVRADWAKASEYYAQGIFRQLWMSGYGVIALCEAESQEHLQQLLATLPMAQAGYVDIEIRPLAPYVGFGPDAHL